MKSLRLFFRWLTGNWWYVVPNEVLGSGWCIRNKHTGRLDYYQGWLDHKGATIAASIRNHRF